jgi:putative transposase
MAKYRRNFVPGGTYFFTCVTYERQRILTSELGRRCLREAIHKVRSDHPFHVFAIVLLPDHLHTVWTLPPGDSDYPLRWMRIKEEFTKRWLQSNGTELSQSESRRKHRYRGVWQKRYWEHTVQDQADLKRCVDYSHWNPRKHNLVRRVCDWEYSSFHRFVKVGEYDIHWGDIDPVASWNDPEWGEFNGGPIEQM